MLNEYLISLILESIGMPAEIIAGILALYQQGLIKLCISALTVCITMVCISLRRSFIEQSGMAARHEPVAVAASGLILYGVCISLMLIFILSVIGFPVSILVFFIMSFFIFIGIAALSVMLGNFFAGRLNKVMYIYQSAFAGAIIIEIIKYIPYIDWMFQYLILPVFALGAVATGFSNGYLKKRFYPMFPECKPYSKRANIRSRILKK